jgi:hypothetical protein
MFERGCVQLKRGRAQNEDEGLNWGGGGKRGMHGWEGRVRLGRCAQVGGVHSDEDLGVWRGEEGKVRVGNQRLRLQNNDYNMLILKIGKVPIV